MADLYSGGHDRRSPRLSPACADLHSLPPLLIQVSSSEALADDALTVTRKAALADVPVSLTVWSGYFHVFHIMPDRLEGAHRALRDGVRFFADVLGNDARRQCDPVW